jgi:rhodanese-related sulfurtransferase
MKKHLWAGLILVLCFLLVGFYKGYVSPEGKVLKKYLEPEELKKLVEKPDESIWIIDVRPSPAYKKGHIPTAKSFPSSAILSRLNEIPKDKYLIIYCETGGRAQMVIRKLEKEGYTRMMNWGGYKRWKYGFVQEISG